MANAAYKSNVLIKKMDVTKNITVGIMFAKKAVHKSQTFKYPSMASLKLPNNVIDINSTETSSFSPLRERDITGPVINAYHSFKENRVIDITNKVDPHINKYDCRGAVSLSSSMQSNVPSPFSGNHTHLNMPGSQWGQGYKYLSDHLHSAHYLTLRNQFRNKKIPQGFNIMVISNMSTKQTTPLTSKEKLKHAIKEYGATVMVFHISISLISLGGCYLLISSGIDLVALLKYFNIEENMLSKVAASNAGTFVVAYAVHKFFAPFRIAVTLMATPFIVRHLRKIGFLKAKPGGG